MIRHAALPKAHELSKKAFAFGCPTKPKGERGEVAILLRNRGYTPTEFHRELQGNPVRLNRRSRRLSTPFPVTKLECRSSLFVPQRFRRIDSHNPEARQQAGEDSGDQQCNRNNDKGGVVVRLDADENRA